MMVVTLPQLMSEEQRYSSFLFTFKSLLPLLIIFSKIIFPQNDSVKEASKYYPLHTGNYWEYEINVSQIPYPDETYYESVSVEGDTLLANNKQYKILVTRDLVTSGIKEIKYERIDTLTACIYRFRNDSTLTNREFLVDSLLAKPGDEFFGSWHGFSSNSDNPYHSICTDVTEDTVFTIITSLRTSDDQSTIPTVSFTLAKGFGFYSSLGCEFSCGYQSLRYAIINGVEYGTKIVGVKNDKINSQSTFHLYQNYPNPFNPSTLIKYSVLKSGRVSLKVYDVLGNEVATLVNEEKQPGNYETVFDTKGNNQNLASGIYFYQLRTGDFVKTKKRVLLR